jgi:hypothetical protein
MPTQTLRRSSALAIALLLTGCALLPVFVRDVSLSYGELTERLSKRFPMERNIADFLSVTLMRPRVSAVADTSTAPSPAPGAAARPAMRLAITVDLEVKLPSLLNKSQRSLWGSMTLSGVPRFDAQSRSVQIDDAKLDRVRVDNMATQLAKEYLEAKPIYTLSPEQTERLGLKSPATSLVFDVQPDRLVVRRT